MDKFLIFVELTFIIFFAFSLLGSIKLKCYGNIPVLGFFAIGSTVLFLSDISAKNCIQPVSSSIQCAFLWMSIPTVIFLWVIMFTDLINN